MCDIHEFSSYRSIYQLGLFPVGIVLKFHENGRRQIKCKFNFSRKISTSIPVSIHETPKSSTAVYADYLHLDPTKLDNKYGIWR